MTMPTIDRPVTDGAGAGPTTAPGRRVRSVRLLQFTDTHLLEDPAQTMRGAHTLPRLQACLEHARRYFFPADIVAVTGDIVHDEPGAYGAAELLFGALDTPVLLIPGNHDVPDELRRRLGRAPFQVGGEFVTANGWQILLLESWFAESQNGEGRLGDAQVAFVRAALACGTQPHAFVFLHHPPVSMDAPALDELGLLDAQELRAALAGHARVRGVCWGHAHQGLDIYAHGDVRFMCTPATAMQFRPRHPTFAVDDRPPGYRVIDLRDDGSIASEVVWLEGYRD
jgi:3',5'-cyclic-AMP phosphodiesterase